jgi:hypothetical protein
MHEMVKSVEVRNMHSKDEQNAKSMLDFLMITYTPLLAIAQHNIEVEHYAFRPKPSFLPKVRVYQNRQC